MSLQFVRTCLAAPFRRAVKLSRITFDDHRHIKFYSSITSSLPFQTEMDLPKVRSEEDLHNEIMAIYNTANDAVLPLNMVHKSLKVEGDTLIVNNVTYPLNHNIHVIGFGKAVLGMVRAVEQILGDHIVGGIVSIPDGIQETFTKAGKRDLLLSKDSRVRVFEGSPNNIPDDRAHQTALDIYNMVKALKPDDIALALITGGGSALLPAPVPPLTLNEVVKVTHLMSTKGATIQQLNTVRKHLELLKGGGLAGAVYPAKVISLILSDVIGNSLDLIASGPTVPDFSTPQQCLDCFETLGILDEVPKPILDFLQEEAINRQLTKTIANTSHATSTALSTGPIKAPIPNHNCENANNVVVGSNAIAVEAARSKAQELGYLTYILSLELDGEARQVGYMLSSLAEFVCHCIGNLLHTESRKPLVELELKLIGQGISKETVNDLVTLARSCCNSGRAICLLASGETVVKVKGTGKGGRNQELALSAAIHMKNNLFVGVREVFDVLLLSCGTDGQDGPTDAAGAYASLSSLEGCATFIAEEYLDNNDAYNFYKDIRKQDLIITGLTGTNVMDIQILLIQPKPKKLHKPL